MTGLIVLDRARTIKLERKYDNSVEIRQKIYDINLEITSDINSARNNCRTGWVEGRFGNSSRNI